MVIKKGKRKRKEVLQKSCIFCWKPLLDNSNNRHFQYGQREYVVHLKCLLTWDKAHSLIHSGNLYHGMNWRQLPFPQRGYYLFVEHFFKILKNVDPSVLLTPGSDYLTFVD